MENTANIYISKRNVYRDGRIFAIYYKYCGKEDHRLISQSKALLCLSKNMYKGRKYWESHH